jgi:hypothetical protein
MSTTSTSNRTALEEPVHSRQPDWLTILFWIVVAALFVIAVVMRLHTLGQPFDRDGYDEGVYWQSLRAMSAGHALYGDIFYSQPPFFLLSTFPFYSLFGGTLWSARLGIALVSLVGLVGAFLLGWALSGRPGALLALLLAITNPLYLAQSQTIQAEAASTAFSFLAAGLALLWWKYPLGGRGLLLAILTGITVALSILSKLLGVALLVPIVLLMSERLWHGTLPNVQEDIATGVQTHRIRPYASVAAGILAFVVTMAALLLPFAGAYHAFIAGVITFHTDAASILGNTAQYRQSANTGVLKTALVSLLGLAALYGTAVSLLRQDWRVLPLLGWFAASAFLLWRQVPLFPHHMVSLVPPFLALAVMGITPSTSLQKSAPGTSSNAGKSNKTAADMVLVLSIIAVVLLLLVAGADLSQDASYYRTAQARSVDGLAQLEARVAADLRSAITPDQQVITDAQFVAGLAGRDTPPSLVDTSMVRIETGYLTLAQLEAAASQSQVHAVLFFSGRFSLPQVAAFHAWVAQHFHMLHDYGAGRQLWVR